MRLILGRYSTYRRSRPVLNSRPYRIQMAVLITQLLTRGANALLKFLFALSFFALSRVMVASTTARSSLNANLPDV